MAKKFYGSKGFANMPQNVIQKSYPKKKTPMSDGSYVDTQEGLDKEFSKMSSKVRKGARK